MKANRVLGLTLALDATRLGKGINDAMRSLGGFEHHAHKTARRLSSSLGKTLASELPKDIRRMRLAVRGEGIQLASDQKRLDKEMFNNRLRREGLRKQMSDLRHFAAERNRIYNEDVKRIRSQRKLEDDQLNHKQRALRMRVRAEELGIEQLGKAAQTHLIKGTRLQMRDERLAYRSAQHGLGGRLRQQTSLVENLSAQQRQELLSRKGKASDALREAQERLLTSSSIAKQTKAENIFNLQQQRKRVKELESTYKAKKIEYDDAIRVGIVPGEKQSDDYNIAKHLYEKEAASYAKNVQNARTFNRDWVTLKNDLDEDVRRKQHEARSSLGGTQFDSSLQQAIADRSSTLSQLSSNRIAYKQRELEIEDQVLMDQLKQKHGIEQKEVDKLKEITRLKSDILDIDRQKFDLDSKRGALEYRHGFTPDETMAMNQIRKKMFRANKERKELDSIKEGMYDRKIQASRNKELLRQNEIRLMDEQEVAAQLQGSFDVISQMATAALVTGFGLVFSADFFRRQFINPALQRFSEFETELTRYRSISGVNLADPKQADTYKRDLELIRKTSLKSGYSGTETARSLSNLISAGLDPEVSRQMLPSVLNVVQASYGEIDPEAAGKIMATIFQKFDLSKYGDIKAQSEYMADWVFQLKQASKLEFGEVEGFLSSLQASPAILRMGTEDIGALGTVLMRLGASPRNAAQQINALSPNLARIMRKLSESVKVKGGAGKFIEKQNKLGYNLSDKDFFNEDLTMKDGMSVLKAIYDGYQRSKKSEGAGPAEVGLYNMFQTSRGLNLMRSIEQFRYKTAAGDEQMGWDALERLRTEFNAEQISGKTAKAADEFRASPTGLAKQFENIGTTLYTAFGRQVFEGVAESLLKLTQALSAFAEWVDKHPDVAGFVTKLGLAFTALATGLGLLLVVGGGAFFLLSQILGLLASIVGLGIGSAVILAAPYIFAYVVLLGTIAGTLGLIVGLVALAFGSDNIIDAFNNKLEQAKMIFSGLAEMWSDYTAPEELFVKMREAGVWPLVRAVLMLKYRFEQLWDGLDIGTQLVRDQLKNITSVLVDDMGDLFGLGGMEFTDAEKWKLFGFALGKLFSGLFVGAILFVFSLVLITKQLKELKAEFDKHPEVYRLVAYTLLGVLGLAIIGVMGLMALLGLSVLAVTWPLLALTLLVMKFWSFMTGDIAFNYESGFLGYLSAVANSLRDILLMMLSVIRLSGSFIEIGYGVITGDAGMVMSGKKSADTNLDNIGGLYTRMGERRDRFSSNAYENEQASGALQQLNSAGGTPRALRLGPKLTQWSARQLTNWASSYGNKVANEPIANQNADTKGYLQGKWLVNSILGNKLFGFKDGPGAEFWKDTADQMLYDKQFSNQHRAFWLQQGIESGIHPLSSGFSEDTLSKNYPPETITAVQKMQEYDRVHGDAVKAEAFRQLDRDGWLDLLRESRQVNIQKIEVVAPQDINDPGAWGKALTDHVKFYLSTESE